MRSDIDRLMAERNLDAIVIEGPDGLGSANPAFNYLVKGQKLTGTVLKKRGEPAMLVHSPWEQMQAQETGLVLVPSDRWNMREIIEQTGSRFNAVVEYRRRMFEDLGIGGRVGIYGTVEAGPSFALLAALSQRMAGLEIVAEFEQDLISAARLTKEPDEVERIREVGRRTVAVVQAVVDFIKQGRADGDRLVDANGKPLTIGDMHALIQRETAAQGLESPQGFIFSQGRDAGLPHAHGDENAPLMLGQPIVFDFYPREQGGGYYHDMTRTFAIGYASPELQKLYDDVLGVFEHVTGELESGAPTKVYQDMTCQYFEQRGYETIGSKYPIDEGYIHSLGHGIGLEVHEDYGFPSLKDRGDVLTPGAVFTVEPGLYYPNQGLGVRIEDTYYCTPDGTFESLTPFPKDLVIPIHK
ncbi:MAG TPA: Xaa-Pro peptidase family protein [Roseiflexaceae bacterium]|nr:Xaa-Pro peptidase family protein [Roseiflexaceae bacterium]